MKHELLECGTVRCTTLRGVVLCMFGVICVHRRLDGVASCMQAVPMCHDAKLDSLTVLARELP